MSSRDRLRVVYVAGSGHTGSTMLAMLLDSHPRIASVGEVAVKPAIRRRGDYADQRCSCGESIARCAFWQDVFQAVNRQGFQFSATDWSNDYRCDNPLLHKVLTRNSGYRAVRTFQRWAAAHLPVHRARMAHIHKVNVAFVRAVLEIARADVFVDTSKGATRLHHLMSVPELDISVVRLVRDARAYAASAKRRGKSVREAARTWRRDQLLITEVTSALPADRQFTVRYEDLCSNLRGTLRRVHEFCGVEPMTVSGELVSTEHHVLGNNMRQQGAIQVRLDETWRSQLGHIEQQEVMKIAGAMNQAFGYV